MKRLLAAIAMTLAATSMAQASGLATGEQISAAISGNTVQGSMVAAGAYTEFYGADGVIKGKDYSGKWRVNGDTMCFQYGTDPEACWGVKISGSDVTWVKDGKDEYLMGGIFPLSPKHTPVPDELFAVIQAVLGDFPVVIE